MKKYILDVLESEKEHAGSKAKTDISFFLHDLGYLSIFIDRDVSKFEKYLFARSNIKSKLSKLTQEDILIIQYPLYAGSVYMSILMRELQRIHPKTILVLHDVYSLRDSSNDSDEINKEIGIINHFDVVISHNEEMTRWLKSNGLRKKVINLNLFDYYNSNKIINHSAEENRIVFAGNLAKANFLSDLNNESSEILLYGPNLQQVNSNKVHYEGSFPPNELPRFLEGNYGLVWDGNSILSCNGKYGDYLKYNNPHKVSLYISCGLPVIIWDQAALAKLVIKNNLGLAISSLSELDKTLGNVSEEQYQSMKQNVIKAAAKVRSGYFIKKAIEEAESALKTN